MKKFKIFADFEKEAQYLDDMAKSGFRLKKYNSLGMYTFERAESQDLRHRIDYRTFKNKVRFEEYLTLFRDAGWEHVYGTPQSGSQYFLPIPNAAQTDDIFSDEESKAGRYKRFEAQCVSSFALAAAWLNIIWTNNDWSIWNVKSWYLTHGLWEMTGSLFWKAFLFETPFVLLRTAPPIVCIALAILYGYWATKARKLYKNNLSC